MYMNWVFCFVGVSP